MSVHQNARLTPRGRVLMIEGSKVDFQFGERQLLREYPNVRASSGRRMAVNLFRLRHWRDDAPDPHLTSSARTSRAASVSKGNPGIAAGAIRKMASRNLPVCDAPGATNGAAHIRLWARGGQRGALTS